MGEYEVYVQDHFSKFVPKVLQVTGLPVLTRTCYHQMAAGHFTNPKRLAEAIY